MVATRGRTFKRPWGGSCHSSKLKSSSAPIGRKDSWCFHAVGSSNAPLLGSTAAEGLQRIGRTSIATRWRSCGLPQSASCSENFVIPPDVFGQTLRDTLLIRVGRRILLRYIASVVLPLWRCCITSREAKPLRAFWSDRFRVFENNHEASMRSYATLRLRDGSSCPRSA